MGTTQRLRFVLLSGVLAGLTSCGKPPPPPVEDFLPAHKILLVTTTTHLADLAREVGGEVVTVQCLLTNAAAAAENREDKPVANNPDVESVQSSAKPWNPNPFQWQVNAGELFQMRTAKVVVMNGLGLEKGLAEEVAKLRELGVAVACIGDELRKEEVILRPDGSPDPCIWNSPRLMIRAAEIVAETLKKTVAPEAAPYFDQRYHQFQDRYSRMHDWAAKQMAAVPASKRCAIASHDTLRYFAREFDLQTRAIFAADGSPLSVSEKELLAWLDANGIADLIADATAISPDIDEISANLRLIKSPPVHTVMLAKPGTKQMGLVESLDVGTAEGAFRLLVRTVERRMGGGNRILLPEDEPATLEKP